MIKQRLDEVYNEVVQPLESFSSSYSKGSINRMMEYMKVFGDVMVHYGEKANTVGNELLNQYPDKKDEIQSYVNELGDKIVATYKPK